MMTPRWYKKRNDALIDAMLAADLGAKEEASNTAKNEADVFAVPAADKSTVTASFERHQAYTKFLVQVA